ncbi:MAG: ubiquinol-cytochrome c reductase iron-sulfur subunit [Pseudomonadota bacterium]|nr:ubiquinol-cytochrome c reductase iron-sulfur subunit [Pseudomonadota bacterium]
MCSNTDLSRRQFLQKALSAMVGVGVLASLFPFLRSWFPSQQTLLSEAPVRCDISTLEPGDLMTVLWQGKPVWILRRTPLMVQSLTLNNSQLRDPHSREAFQPANIQNDFRSLHQEYFVAIGQCTHMGCIPMLKQKAFVCPCHGSRFDLAGRVVKDVPAPRNLDIPPYRFDDLGQTIVIGET